MKHIFMILLMIIAASALAAQSTFTAYPFLAYSGETKLMGGAFSFFRYQLKEPILNQGGESISLLNNVLYSQKNQFLLVLLPQYRSEDWDISATAILQDWPSTFYGTGNATLSSDEESYTTRLYAVESKLNRDLGRNLNASVRLSQGWHKVRKELVGGNLEHSGLAGLDPSFYSGAGYSIAYDSTDRSYYPTAGIKIELLQLFFTDVLGSDFNYTQSQYDLRTYFPLGDKSVFALQSDLVSNKGSIPFFNYAELGSRLRAYDSKRFIDKVRIAQRAEHRVFPFEGGFSRRLGFVLFAETGQVAPALKDIRLKDWHYSVGGGLRFSILPDEKLNLRMDLGFGDDSVNFIVNAREVF
jgi:outer membrane protein assembly factor BamA